MIKITSGTVRTSQGLKTSKDKPFALPPEEEQRFIDRKVAARVYQEAPLEPVATPPVAPEGEGVDVNSSEEKPGAEGEETAGNLNADQLKTMRLDELKQMAKNMGIDTTGLRSKEDYAKALAVAKAVVEDLEDLPNLSAEDPVE